MAKICTFLGVVWARPPIFFSFQLKLGTVCLKSRTDPDFWKKSSFFCKMSSKLAVSPIFSQFCPFLAKNCLKIDFFRREFRFFARHSCISLGVNYFDRFYFGSGRFGWKKWKFGPFLTHFWALNHHFEAFSSLLTPQNWQK